MAVLPAAFLALAAGRAGATAPTGPPSVVVLGDSTAMTLSAALAATAPVGTTVRDGGTFGCGLVVAQGITTHPPRIALPMFPACNAATPAAGRWPALDTEAVAAAGPGDVVLFVAGLWEVVDLVAHGHVESMLSPSFRAAEAARLRLLVHIATAHGARLELFTMPAMDVHLPDANRREALYDRLLRQTAAEFPRQVRVVHYRRLLSPGGVYRLRLDGVEVRAADGIHTPSYAPGNPFIGNSSAAVASAFDHWLAPRIWPLIERGGAQAGGHGDPRHALGS